jgi:hypothetical protein
MSANGHFIMRFSIIYCIPLHHDGLKSILIAAQCQQRHYKSPQLTTKTPLNFQSQIAKVQEAQQWF